MSCYYTSGVDSWIFLAFVTPPHLWGQDDHMLNIPLGWPGHVKKRLSVSPQSGTRMKTTWAPLAPERNKHENTWAPFAPERNKRENTWASFATERNKRDNAWVPFASERNKRENT